MKKINYSVFTKGLILFGLSLVLSWSSFGQKSDSVYSFPFHMQSRLLVFSGEMNGQATNFAFDTGAAMGLAGKSFSSTKRVKIRGKRMTIRDSNNETKKVRTAYTDEIKIGGLKISNVKSLIYDMPFLSCQDFYLLGSNVIKLLNWEIDFEKKIVRVSQVPFPVKENYLALPVTYKNTRPFAELSFRGMKLSNILIDFGYSKVLDLDLSSELISNYIQSKDNLGLTHTSLSHSSGAVSQKTEKTINILLDTLALGNGAVYQIPTEFIETQNGKIGLSFFSTLSKKTIINNSESTYFLYLKHESPKFLDPSFLNLRYSEGKILISGKSLEKIPSHLELDMGEEVSSVNGISMSDFSDECAFVNWYYRFSEDKISIITKSGKKLSFERMPLLSGY